MAQLKTYDELCYSVEEYLEMERELIDDEIYAMAGESTAHADISFNLAALFGNKLRGTNYRGRTKDTKVKSGDWLLREYEGWTYQIKN